MDEFIVETRDGVAAAIKAAAQPSYEKARANPFIVRFMRTVYTFQWGVTEANAKHITRNIRRTPESAFPHG